MPSSLRFLDHGGEMAARIRDHDWAATPLGPPAAWPVELRFALDMALGSSFPSAIYWGREFTLLYNDAWAVIPADRHPWSLGRAGSEVWADIWDTVGPQMDRVLETGEGFAVYDQFLPMERDGRAQETWWNYSFTPIRDAAGRVLGILNQGNETTRMVLAERARREEIGRLRELFQQAPGAVVLLHGPQHRIEIANPAYVELVGGRVLVGRTIAEALPEVVGQGFVALLDTVFESGEPYRASGTPVHLDRGADGRSELRLLDFVYQPIKDADGNTTDIFVQATDVTEREQAQAALRASEERLQLALDSSMGVGTWLWDVPADLVTADSRFLRLYGVEDVEPGEGAPIEAFFRRIHPEDRTRVETAIGDVLEHGGTFAEEYRLVQNDGSIRWVSAQGRCMFDEDGRPLRFPGVSFDITQRREAEESARRTAEELREATEGQAFIYALSDRLRTLDTPGAILRFTSAALAKRLGAERVGFYRVVADGTRMQFGPSFTGERLPVLSGEAELANIGHALLDAYRNGRTVAIEDTSAAPAVGLDVARRAAAAIGVPLLRGGEWVATLYVNEPQPRTWTAEEIAFAEAVAEIAWDAVERVAAVQALKESEEKFRAIANSIDQMIWSTRPDGFHDYYNDRWYEFTGAPHGSTDGSGWNDMFHPDDQQRAASIWRHCLDTGEPYHIEYRLRHHGGGYRWVLGRAQPVRDEDGRITRWFGTCTDIQEIVDAREVLARSREELERAVQERTFQLIRAEEQLRQAQKMEAVGQLTGGIAHDFNNMLAVVIGALDLMERRMAQGRTDIERYVTAARDGATRAAALTQRLLAFSRQQPLAPVPLDANRAIEGMVELLARTLGEAITVETRLLADLRAALVDPIQLENTILNLAVNARDAMPGGGTLVIETGNRAIGEDEARSFGVEPGDYVKIAVCDTGTGMPPEVIDRAFDPFFTTKGVGRGTGLGLSQVFGFARQSGGHVRITSAPGEGTRVLLYLPVHHGALPADAVPGAARELPRARAGETVLVVEDEDRVRAFSAEALRELGYSVLDATGGPEALALIEAGQRFDLLFTDIVMPEMTGRQLAERARMRLPGLRVLFTSGYSREDAQDELAQEVLAKPFDLDRLAVAVRAALDVEPQGD